LLAKVVVNPTTIRSRRPSSVVVRYNDEHAYKKLDADYSSTNIFGLKYHALT